MTFSYHNSACKRVVKYFKFAKQWRKSHLSWSIRLEMAEKRKSVLMKKTFFNDFAYTGGITNERVLGSCHGTS